MKKTLAILWIVATLLLTACTGEIQTYTPTPTEQVSVEEPTKAPTATTATPAEQPEATKPPAVKTAAANACVPIVGGIPLPQDVFLNPAFETQFEAYLNAGGAIRELPAAIKAVEGGMDAKIQVVSADMDDDDTPEVFLSITLPYGEGAGETHLMFFNCVDGSYKVQVLFRRAGAGNQSEGLYAGGGARVEYINDFNDDGQMDLIISVNWENYREYYVVTFDGSQFNNILSYRDELGEHTKKIPMTEGELKVVDLDGDGVYEIVAYGADGKILQVWRWDGEYYSLGQG